MSLTIYLIWLGGACAYPNRKIGFWLRAFWFVSLGERLGEMALKDELK